MCDDAKTAQAAKKLKQVRSWAGGTPLPSIGGDTKTRVNNNKCIGCGNALPEDVKVYHDNCAGKAKRNVKRDAKIGERVDGMKSSHEINNTHLDKYGRNQLGVRHFGCGCNAMNAQHGKNCKYSGPISDKLRKGLE